MNRLDELLYNLYMMAMSGYLDGSVYLALSPFFWLITASYAVSILASQRRTPAYKTGPQLHLTACWASVKCRYIGLLCIDIGLLVTLESPEEDHA